MRRRGFIFIMPIFVLAWFFVFGASARAADITVDIDTVWAKAQSPIIVMSMIWVKPGVNLIIEKGVVVKFNSSGMLIVSGKLTAIGTKAEPIIFTSIKDDANGGDTNGGGAASQPKPGDWYYLSINQGGEANLNYNVIQYGGGVYYGAVLNYKGKVTINNSIITKNNAGISNRQSVLTISNSSIINNLMPFTGNVWVDAAISNNGQSIIMVNAVNNWWGTADGPCVWRLLPPADVKSICGNRPLVDLGVVYSPWLNAPPEEPAEPAAFEPVIIVPGIMGSWNMSGRWQLDPILHTYDNLVEALIAAGYKENSLSEDKPTLFTFPYDWRQDNNLTANLLEEKIQAVKAITGSNKVDIVAHSMGGLVTRSYVEGGGYQNDIDQVIFLGAPHQGSVESYLGYEGAYFRGSLGPVQTYLFQIEAAFNGYLDLTDYIRAKVLTVEQLLPVFDYLKDKQPDNSWQLRPYPLNYPQNNYLENLNSQANVNLLKQRVKITNIIGDLGQSSTLNSFRVIADSDLTDNKWQSGYPENLDQNLDSLEMGNGDGTVPLSSANSLDGVEIFKTGISDHANLPTIMQKEIIKTLTGKLPENYYNSKITSTFKRWVFFRVYSPVDFAVVDPDGRKIGKDFASSTEINQIPDAFYSGFNGQAEFVLIPNPLDGEYKVEARGVANGGEYTLANSVIDGDKETTKEFSGSIAPEQERDFNIIYSAASENPLSELKPEDTTPPLAVINQPREGGEYPSSESLAIDYAADDDFSGLATTTIMIDGKKVATTTIHFFNYSLGGHTLTITVWDKAGNQGQAQVNFTIIDIVPPVVTINRPVEADKYLRSDNLVINYTATDDFSGIATTTMAIDGQAVATTTVDLFGYSLGIHNLIVQAIDQAGNQAQAQINFEIIANIDSTISDIEKINELGWFKGKIYHALLEDAFKLLKIEAKFFDKEQDLTEKLVRKTQDDRKLTDKQKQKLIEQYNKKLVDLKKDRVKAINKSLDLITKLLDKAKDKNQINQPGYDIIISDINYLRINL